MLGLYGVVFVLLVMYGWEILVMVMYVVGVGLLSFALSDKSLIYFSVLCLVFG